MDSYFYFSIMFLRIDFLLTMKMFCDFKLWCFQRFKHETHTTEASNAKKKKDGFKWSFCEKNESSECNLKR